jgi:hypothetical protein
MFNGKVSCMCGYGKATLSTSTTTLSAYRVQPPFARDSLVTSGMRNRGTSSMHNVGQHGEINGRMYMDTVWHDPGTIVLLTASKTFRGITQSDGGILLRLRVGAAHLNIQAALPTGLDNYLGPSFCMFSGCADLLSVEEADVLGIRIPRGYIEKFFDPEQIEERFSVTEIAAETIPRPEFMVVATPTGTKIKEVAHAPSRRIRIRK